MIKGQAANLEHQLEGQDYAQELIDQGKAYGKAVKDGDILASMNPWFLLGAQMAFGRSAASDFNLYYQEALAKSPIRNSIDADEWQAFIQGQKAEYLRSILGDAEPSEAFLRAYNGEMVNQEARIDSEAAGTLSRNLVQQNLDTWERRVGQVLGDIDTADPNARITFGEASGILTKEAAEMIVVGVHGATVNDILRQGVADYAFIRGEHGLELFEQVLRGIKTPAGNMFDNDLETKTLYQKLELDIYSRNNIRSAEEERVRELKKKQDFEDILTRMMQRRTL
jgi:hypothetical protein